jgi:hypothetical protein
MKKKKPVKEFFKRKFKRKILKDIWAEFKKRSKLRLITSFLMFIIITCYNIIAPLFKAEKEKGSVPVLKESGNRFDSQTIRLGFNPNKRNPSGTNTHLTLTLTGYKQITLKEYSTVYMRAWPRCEFPNPDIKDDTGFITAEITDGHNVWDRKSTDKYRYFKNERFPQKTLLAECSFEKGFPPGTYIFIITSDFYGSIMTPRIEFEYDVNVLRPP